MNTTDITTFKYGVNIYSNCVAHVIKSWKDVSNRKYVTLCGRAGGGNSALMNEVPSCYEVCEKCLAKEAN